MDFKTFLVLLAGVEKRALHDGYAKNARANLSTSYLMWHGWRMIQPRSGV